jgi:phosphoribosylformimino-5-aminoimidazole carboxamide ribonucleotide (ProFAR) isomerase
VLIPCIDLQGGQAVQLVHGRRRELAVADVFGLLDKFQKYPWLHLIDLDAAIGKTDKKGGGKAGNDALIHELCVRARELYGMKVRVGGGIRSVARAAAVAGWGAEQIIVGSAAFCEGKVNLPFLRQLVKKVDPPRIVVALDTAKGRIVTHGWRRKVPLRAEDVMAQMEPFCSAFLCTDVDREGTMTGANLEWFRKLRQVTTLPVIAAGGIKARREVSALEKIGMDAAVGMAMYKNRLR